LDAALLAMVLRWLILFVVLAGLLAIFRAALRWWAGRTVPAVRASREPEPATGPMPAP